MKLKTLYLFVGLLKINGDTSENGNINLSLKEIDSPIAILPGTKELSLTKLLDKEVRTVPYIKICILKQKLYFIHVYELCLQGISGPSSVYVNIICERKHTADPVSISRSKFRILIELVFTEAHHISFKSKRKTNVSGFISCCLVLFGWTILICITVETYFDNNFFIRIK